MKRNPTGAIVNAKVRAPTLLYDWCQQKAKEKGLTFNTWVLMKLWAEYEQEMGKEEAS